MNTSVNHINATANNANVNAKNATEKQFIDANYSNGFLSVGIYNPAERNIVQPIFFKNAANALNYAFLLKKRHGINIARRAFDLIQWEIKRTGAISTRAAQRITETAQAETAQETAKEVGRSEVDNQTAKEKTTRKRATKAAENA